MIGYTKACAKLAMLVGKHPAVGLLPFVLLVGSIRIYIELAFLPVMDIYFTPDSYTLVGIVASNESVNMGVLHCVAWNYGDDLCCGSGSTLTPYAASAGGVMEFGKVGTAPLPPPITSARPSVAVRARSTSVLVEFPEMLLTSRRPTRARMRGW